MKLSFALLLVWSSLVLSVLASTYYRQVREDPSQGWGYTHVSIEEPLCEYSEAVWMKHTEWAICVARNTVMPADCLDWNATECLQHASWIDCEYLVYRSVQSACVLFHRTLTIAEKERICQSPSDRAKYSTHVKCQERVRVELEYMGIITKVWELAPESRNPSLYPPVPLRATVVKRIPPGTCLVEELSV